MIKFTQNAIIQNGNRFPCWYTTTGKDNQDIRIVAEFYRGFMGLEGFSIHDDSDSMTDYFCKPSITLTEGSEFYNEAKKAMTAKIESREKARAKKALKKAQLLESIENKKKVLGVWYEIITSEPSQRLAGFITYKMKKISNQAKKIYFYSESIDGKRYTKPYSISF